MEAPFQNSYRKAGNWTEEVSDRPNGRQMLHRPRLFLVGCISTNKARIPYCMGLRRHVNCYEGKKVHAEETRTHKRQKSQNGNDGMKATGRLDTDVTRPAVP